MKFGFKEYFKPTPKRLRIFGDSLAAAATFGGSVVALNGDPKIGTGLMVLGVVGKFISNFFSEEKSKENA